MQLSFSPFPVIVSSAIVPYRELSESVPSITAAIAVITTSGEDNRYADMKRDITKSKEHFFPDMPVRFDKKLNYKQYPQLLTNIQADNEQE